MKWFKKKSYFETHKYSFSAKNVYIRSRFGLPMNLIIIMKWICLRYQIPTNLKADYFKSANRPEQDFYRWKYLNGMYRKIISRNDAKRS